MIHLLLFACQKEAEVLTPPDVAGFLFLDEFRYQEILLAIDEKRDPIYTAAMSLFEQADQAIYQRADPPAVFYAPPFYEDPEGRMNATRPLALDASAAYAAGLAYALTSEEAYADATVRLIKAWITEVQHFDTRDDSQLVFSLHFTAFIIAADFVHSSTAFRAELATSFMEFLRLQIPRMNALRDGNPNNHSDWAVLMLTASAAFLQDNQQLDQAEDTWKSRLVDQLTPYGILHREVTRNNGTGTHGINYSHVALHAMALSAEMLRISGRDVFNYLAPEGQSLELAFQTLVPWVEDPSSFPFYDGPASDLVGVNKLGYWEIMLLHYANDFAQRTVQQNRPLDDIIIGFNPHFTLLFASTD